MRMETLTMNSDIALSPQMLIGIYEEHSPGIFRYAYRLLGDADMAEECVAETFSKFLAMLKQRKAHFENVQAYLYRVAHNWITDYYRRQPPPQEPFEDQIQAIHGSDPAREVIQNFERERVREALMKLPPEQRQVVALRFLEEQSHDQVAATLGKTVEATRALQHRALAALRRMLLEPEEVENG